MDIPRPNHSNYRRLARLAWYPTAIAALALLLVSLPGYPSLHFLATGLQLSANHAVDTVLGLLGILASSACAIVSLGLAALIFFRRGEDNMALFVSYYLLGYGALVGGPLEAALLAYQAPIAVAYSVQTAIFILPTAALLFTFPSGHFVPRWTIWLTLLSVPLTVISLQFPGSDWQGLVSSPIRLIALAVVLLMALGIAAQIYRYRRVSSIIERQQTKWVVGGLALWFVYMLVTIGTTLPLGLVSIGRDSSHATRWLALGSLSWWLGLTILPVSLTIAVMRNRLFAIDIIIRRTLVYGLLTATLALIYFGTVVLLQAAFGTISGQQSPLAVVVSTLLIAALFTPLRRRIQDAIDRRFFRPRYNAAQALSRFARTARDEVELDALTLELLHVVDETMQPESLGLWFRREKQYP